MPKGDRPNHLGGPSASRSTPRTVMKISTKRGRCPGSGGSTRPTTGMLAPKDVSKCLFTDPLPPMPLEEGQEHVFLLYTKSGDVVSHNYVTTPTRTTTTPSHPQHFHVVGIRTPGGGYGKGLMPSALRDTSPLLRSHVPVGSMRARMSRSSKDLRSPSSSAQ